ncbi:universal stress protein A-like protein isoform X2 [Cynara cardunculus var. scolymus]|uniref:universal stress protein A-like protein isoform X2 n=1 Tax=Cynara cardunculus var. scolymus TaxID=59895 RepID=UPI000D622F9B|nr:universal stress protein A-like protein isoform X2 [Cynara cardunculus var. scolymus]
MPSAKQLFRYLTTPVNTTTINDNASNTLSQTQPTLDLITKLSLRSMERKILVAVDEGEESKYALSWCLKNVVNQNFMDTIVLLYVKPPQVVYTAVDGTGYLFSTDIIATIDKYKNEVAETVIEKAKKLCKDLQNVEAKVEAGDPRDVICEAAEKMAVDMVVLGSHGYGLIKRAFLGSVSNHCAQNIKRPVLIVKKPKNHSANSTF